METQSPLKPKLLIVEDDEPLREQMKLALGEEYEICEAGDRQTALEVFRKERPELVTLDLGLPPAAHGVEEGFATLGALLGIDSSARVIIVTGRAKRDNGRNAAVNGAYAFFSKPYDLDELKTALRRAQYF